MVKLLLNKYTIVGIILIGIILAIYFSGKSAGKNKAGVKPKPAPLPSGGETIRAGFNQRKIASKLFDILDGYYIPSVFGKDERDLLLNDLIGLTNDEFVSVYNDFNLAFGEGETLPQWIRDESGIDEKILGKLEQKFDSLNLA